VDYQTILFAVKDRIATVTLNRPDSLNAWNTIVTDEMSHAMLRCDQDDAIRAVVVTGSGRAFCAGVDMGSGSGAFGNIRSEREKADAARKETSKERAGKYDGYAGPFPWQIRKPVFAAINGHAIGVGITYPMTCDIRIVAENAKIQFAFTRRGVLPELWSHLIVPRVAGLSNAADLLLTGRMIKGREFAEMGLASAALPAERVLEATLERAREVCYAAPVSVAISKRLLWKGLALSFGELGPEEAELFRWTSSQADSIEGVKSFLEKREPDWKLSATNDMPDMGR